MKYGVNVYDLIKLLDSGKIKKKRLLTLCELLYNKNGYLETSNLHHVNSAYDLRDHNINVSIQRKDYSNEYMISVRS